MHVNDWMPTLLSAAAALSSGDVEATHKVKIDEGEIPFLMGDGIDNWAMFGRLCWLLSAAARGGSGSPHMDVVKIGTVVTTGNRASMLSDALVLVQHD